MKINAVSGVIPRISNNKKVNNANTQTSQNQNFGMNLKILDSDANIKRAICGAYKISNCSDYHFETIMKKINNWTSRFMDNYTNETLLLKNFDSYFRKCCAGGIVFMGPYREWEERYVGFDIVSPYNDKKYLNADFDENVQDDNLHIELAHAFIPNLQYIDGSLSCDYSKKLQELEKFVEFADKEDVPGCTRNWVIGQFKNSLSPREYHDNEYNSRFKGIQDKLQELDKKFIASFISKFSDED